MFYLIYLVFIYALYIQIFYKILCFFLKVQNALKVLKCSYFISQMFSYQVFLCHPVKKFI